MIDINMGCPARKVTKGLAGSALMKEPDLALGVIEAVVAAVDLPVSLKMRLGWDENSRNAASIARQAEQAGVGMFFVHGRTRNQFYKGVADWRRIGEVVKAVGGPVFANGDIVTFDDASSSVRQSGAQGVMIGRGAQGRPWFVGQVGDLLAGRAVRPSPDWLTRRDIILRHYEDMLSHYGACLGVRIARKHLGWYVNEMKNELNLAAEDAANWRARLFVEENAAQAVKHIHQLFSRIDAEYGRTEYGIAS